MPSRPFALCVCALYLSYPLAALFAGQAESNAAQLLEKADAALKAQNLIQALDLLDRAEQSNPKQPGLWYLRGLFELASGNAGAALLSFQKEIAINPREARAATQAAQALLKQKRYQEAVEVLEKPIAAAPENFALQTLRVAILLQGGNKTEGIAEAERISKATSEPRYLNNLAYDLAQAGAALRLAQALAEKAVAQVTKECSDASLGTLSKKDLGATNSLATDWDTLGWVYFKQDDLSKAQPYLVAAWLLGRHSAMVGHLQDLFDRQHFGAGSVTEVDMRNSVAIPSLPKADGRADFYVTVSNSGIGEAQFVAGSEALKEASHAIQATPFVFPFPGPTPVKTVRRGTLVCAGDSTPSCRFFLLPATVASAKFGVVDAPGAAADAPGKPLLIRRVEPQYSDEARDAKIEGTVLLSVFIDTLGFPRDVQVVQSLGHGLDEKAKEAVAQWRFVPAARAGITEGSYAHVEVGFRLVGGPARP